MERMVGGGEALSVFGKRKEGRDGLVSESRTG